jgi:hypothetical protein
VNLHLPAQERRPTPRALSDEAAFRERLLAIRHHRYRVRISWLARYTAWAVGLLVLGVVVITGLMGLLHGA